MSAFARRLQTVVRRLRPVARPHRRWPRLSSALTAASAPDRLNYAHLANRQRHVHWHVVPRAMRRRPSGRWRA